MMRLLVVLLLCAACGGPAPHWPEWPVGQFYGAQLVIESQLVYTQRDTYIPYLRSIIERTAAFYGHAPEEVAGLRIVATNGPIPNGQGAMVVGHFDPDQNTVLFRTGYEPDMTCADGVLLPHELLHFYLHGDPTHSDPRWAQLPALQDSLRPLSICP
jgi:hypothetical protein